MNTLAGTFAALLLVATTAALGQAPSDAQIASIVVTANQVDIDAGKLGEAKGSTAAVRAFAKQMVTDHTGVNKQAVALVARLKVTPDDNPTSQGLKKGGEDNLKSLEALKALLIDVRPAFVGHLEHARQIQASLGKN
jgi:putative membrane protein